MRYKAYSTYEMDVKNHPSLPAGFTTLGFSHELHPRIAGKNGMLLKWIRESHISLIQDRRSRL
jgi:hypothetical protein